MFPLFVHKAEMSIVTLGQAVFVVFCRFTKNVKLQIVPFKKRIFAFYYDEYILC